MASAAVRNRDWALKSLARRESSFGIEIHNRREFKSNTDVKAKSRRSLKATLQNEERSVEAMLQGGPAGLFEGVGDLEDPGFAERGAEDLEADGEIFLGRFAARDGDSGDSSEGAG